MKLILFQIKNAVVKVMKVLFSNDNDIMSEEVRDILANPEDAKKYRDAIHDLEKGDKTEVTIELSNKAKLTLVP